MPPPDRWTNYEALGAVIPGTRLITFKVPLKKELCENLPEKEQFTPKNLLSLVSGLGHQLGMVIDLTFTRKYYSAFEFKDEGVRHEKIFTEGHNVPNDDVVYRFFDTLESFFLEQPDEKQVVGVHCTHGINRTGYVVCRYLIERLGWDPEEAMTVYHKSRGYPIERENYIEDLRKRQINEDYKYEGREKLPMKKTFQNRRGNEHQHNREWNHGQGSLHNYRHDKDDNRTDSTRRSPVDSRPRQHRDFHHHRDYQYGNGYPEDGYWPRDQRPNYSDRQRFDRRHQGDSYHRHRRDYFNSDRTPRHEFKKQFYSDNRGHSQHWGHSRGQSQDSYSDYRYENHQRRDRNQYWNKGSNGHREWGQSQSRNDRYYQGHSENWLQRSKYDFDGMQTRESPVNRDPQQIEGQESEGSRK
ncbi:uncharacterized protein LOC111134511 isoform X1 [Crassostrea virginica]